MAQHPRSSVLFLVLMSCCLAALSFSFSPSLPSAEALQVPAFLRRLKNRLSTSVFRNCKVRTINVAEYSSEGTVVHFPQPEDVIRVRDQAGGRGRVKRMFSVGCTPSDREFLMEKLFREGVKSKNFFDGIMGEAADRRAAGAKFAHLVFSRPATNNFVQCPDVVAEWLSDIGVNLERQNCVGINFIAGLKTSLMGSDAVARLQDEASSMTQQASQMQQQLRRVGDVLMAPGLPQGSLQKAEIALEDLKEDAQKVATAVVPLGPQEVQDEPLITPTQATITGGRGNPYYLSDVQ